MTSYDVLVKAIIEVDERTIESEIRKSLDNKIEAKTILNEGLIKAMNIVGDRWKAGDMFLPEVIMCANVMHKGLDILKPLLTNLNQEAAGKVVMGTVAGDIHDIGKKIVRYVLEANGLEVIDIGVGVPDDSFIEAVEAHRPNILGMSALLTTTMPNMGSVIELLKHKGLRDKVKIIVGGASVNEEFATSIGADGYAPDAISALEWVKKELANS